MQVVSQYSQHMTKYRDQNNATVQNDYSQLSHQKGKEDSGKAKYMMNSVDVCYYVFSDIAITAKSKLRQALIGS